MIRRIALAAALPCTVLLAACNAPRPSKADDAVERELYSGTLASVAALPPCNGVPEPDPAWTSTDLGPFSLRLPPGYRKIDVRGYDSYGGQYEAPGREVVFDHGLYSSALEEWRTSGAAFHSCRLEIGGHLAKIVTARSADGEYRAGAAWRELEHDYKGPVHLTVWSTTADAAGQRETLAIFRSVQFKTPASPSP